MIGILHGYSLSGSGSNLWTQFFARALCRLGQEVHLVCQENHPEKYDFICRAYQYDLKGKFKQTLNKKSPYPGRCLLHHPQLEGYLPVYVGQSRMPSAKMVPMPLMEDDEIENYLQRHDQILEKIVSKHPIKFFHANHLVLMSVVAHRLFQRHSIPYGVMPHGSALEYVVKKDPRFHRFAAAALKDAKNVFFAGEELKKRILGTFPQLRGLEEKLEHLPLGVDSQQFFPRKPSQRIRCLKSLLGKIPEEKKRELEPRLKKIQWASQPVLLFVGAILENKGIGILVDALPELMDQIKDLQVLVVGRGPLLEPLKKKASDWGDRVVFFGFLEHSLLPEVYPLADVLVVPSLIPEAGPLVFLEAMASGCLPVGTDQGGMSHHMDQMAPVLPPPLMVNVRLKPEKEGLKKELVEKLPKVFAAKGNWGQVLHQVARDHYDWGQVARQWLKLGGFGGREVPERTQF